MSSKTELTLVLEILLLLGLLEQRGWKHSHSRVAAYVDALVPLLAGRIQESFWEGNFSGVYWHRMTWAEQCPGENCYAKAIGVSGDGLVSCSARSSLSPLSSVSLGCYWW